MTGEILLKKGETADQVRLAADIGKEPPVEEPITEEPVTELIEPFCLELWRQVALQEFGVPA